MDKAEKLMKQYLRQCAGFEYARRPDCPGEEVLLEYLSAGVVGQTCRELEHHFAVCGFCLGRLNIAFEARTWHKQARFVPAGLLKKTKARLGIVEPTKDDKNNKRRMSKKRLFLIATVFFFILSFVITRYFLQFLVASLILGIRWSFESESGQTIIMILDAWRRHSRDKDEEISNRLKNWR